MDLQTLKTADYLDIVFDNRNKSYGGYELRKTYGQRIGKAVAILYSALAGIVLYAVLHKSEPVIKSFVKDKVVVLTQVDPLTPPVIPPPALPKPPQAQEQPRLRTELLTKPVITDDVVPDDRQMAHADALTNANSGTTHSEGEATLDIRDGTAKEGTITTVIDKKPNVPVTWVEQMPEFKGDLVAYLSAHVRYPEMAREANVQGRVMVRFVVNEDGSISDATVLKGIGGGCDEEALRVITKMPLWKAGKQNGHAVKVYFQLPIMFTLQ